MAKHAVDWTLFCHYKLRPNCVEGLFKILQLSKMQIAYTKEVGGVMYNFAAPKESINISVLINVEDKACLDEMKIQTNMVVITKSEKIYNFITSQGIEIIDINCNKDGNLLLYNALTPFVDKFFYDADESIQTVLLKILDMYANKKTLNKQLIQTIEDEVTQVILHSITAQKVNIPSFKGSERIALLIRKKLFHHMDSTISIENLAAEYSISEKSLQTAFKSIFGFTPFLFIRLMKLNLVYHELLQIKQENITVSRVAQKWGFKHMSRFSSYYKELFLELPSETLQREQLLSNGMSNYCVERQEEL